MLVLSRNVGEQICVPQLDMVLTVLEGSGSSARFGIAAPENGAVVRKVLQERSPLHSVQAVTSGTNSQSMSDGESR